MIDNSKPSCLRARCENGKVQFQIKNKTYTCEKEGEMTISIEGEGEKRINCPSASHMCDEIMADRCPMDCSGKGYCMTGNQCQCLAGFTGSDCNTCVDPNSQECKKETNPFVNDYNIENQEDDGEPVGDDKNLPVNIIEMH